MEQPPLSHLVQPGDWIFVAGGDAWYSKWIRKLTFSKVNHVAMVYNENRIFETDLRYGQAVFHLLSRLNYKPLIIIRPTFYKLDDSFQVRELCRFYVGSPYSVWDIITNGLLFWMKDELRAKVIGFLSNKTFMKCDELVARITWEVTGHKTLRGWEGFTPGRLLKIAYTNPTDYEVILNTL